MRRWFFHPVLVFVLAQLAWLSLLGLWIYWYVSNYIIFNKVDERVSTVIIAKSFNVMALVLGLILLLAILIGICLIYIYLNRQLNLNKLYDNFIANITHELKSPLASIHMYLETLKYRNVPAEKQQEFISLMIQDAHRLNNLINSILKISALELKKIAHNFQVCSAQEILKNLIGETTAQFKLSKNPIQIINDGQDCQCVVDRNALKIVFDNIIDNAIKYSPERAQITIKYFCSQKYFVVEVTDQGIGVELKHLKKIFYKFQRVQNPFSPNVKGTGLGLYWVREIIKSHGGRVTASSKGHMKGTTIRVELPIYKTSKQRYTNSLLKITKKEKNLKNLKMDL